MTVNEELKVIGAELQQISRAVAEPGSNTLTLARRLRALADRVWAVAAQVEKRR